MWEYNDTVKEHYKNPKNVGAIENADAIGEVGSLSCGDRLKIYLKIENDVIVDAKFQTFGCGSAVAASSMLTQMVIGKTLEEAKKITNKQIAQELGGLPPEKLHCSVMGQEALENAINGYLGLEIKQDDDDHHHHNENKNSIVCPCTGVTKDEIIKAVKEDNLKTIEQIREKTGATSACGRCESVVLGLINDNTPKASSLSGVQFILKINKVIEANIQAELGKDSGGIELINVEGKDVYVKLRGACSSCKNCMITLKNFVETQLRENVDKDINVIEVK